MKNFSFGNWQVSAFPECGGNLSCVKWHGKDIMRAFTVAEEWKAAPTNYGFAVLFPPNRIDGGKFIFDGKEYQLPVNEPLRGNHVHGVALRQEWQLTNYDDCSLTMEYIFDENNPMYAGFPFKCRLAVKYIFMANAFEQHFTVENLSDMKMPCALGFHSAFAMPEKFNVRGTGKRFELLPPRYLGYGKEIEWTEGFIPGEWCDPRSIFMFGHLRAGNTPHAEFDHGSFKVDYFPDKKFQYWMVWRKEDEFDYICAEPMNIQIGTFENDPEHLPAVMPHEKEIFISRIEVRHE